MWFCFLSWTQAGMNLFKKKMKSTEKKREFLYLLIPVMDLIHIVCDYASEFTLKCLSPAFLFVRERPQLSNIWESSWEKIILVIQSELPDIWDFLSHQKAGNEILSLDPYVLFTSLWRYWTHILDQHIEQMTKLVHLLCHSKTTRCKEAWMCLIWLALFRGKKRFPHSLGMDSYLCIGERGILPVFFLLSVPSACRLLSETKAVEGMKRFHRNSTDVDVVKEFIKQWVDPTTITSDSNILEQKRFLANLVQSLDCVLCKDLNTT